MYTHNTSFTPGCFSWLMNNIFDTQFLHTFNSVIGAFRYVQYILVPLFAVFPICNLKR